ncbi:MerR family transcriptional regulator [Flaviaesturariibacter amylovorans]|uniref:HTH merR-type domain-containing protein n=1 Tax=Flaviaesturariibacter amylovorans TaxID=1084520 RepID=A0ABP8HBQ6_9BACT
MSRFTIRDLATLSGIREHTIRIWEQRYALLRPGRTGSNARLYSIGDLELLLQVAALNRNGYRISQLAALSVPHRNAALAALPYDEARQLAVLHNLLLYFYRFDTAAFEAELCGALGRWPFEVLLPEVLLPFLLRTRLLFGAAPPAQGWAGVRLRQLLHWAIESLPPASAAHAPVLLFSGADGCADHPLLYVQYHLKKAGCPVLPLGSLAGTAELEAVLSRKVPDFLLTVLPAKPVATLARLSALLLRLAPRAELLVLTPEQHKVPLELPLRALSMEEALRTLLAAPAVAEGATR